jgi:hypothetical protein
MQTIWKFDLDGTTLSMPKGAEILSLQIQYGKPKPWALVDTEAEIEKVTIEIYGTSTNIPRLKNGGTRKFIGTFQLANGGLVFHAFKRN